MEDILKQILANQKVILEKLNNLDTRVQPVEGLIKSIKSHANSVDDFVDTVYHGTRTLT